MIRWLPIVFILTGCPGGTNPDLPDDTDTDTDTDTEESEDSDEPVSDSSWGSDTDGGPDTSSETDVEETESDPPVSDTATCAYGEALDCDGHCYPEHYMGDGACDDGGTWPSNFNCVQYLYDKGDCGTAPPPTCQYVMRLDVNLFPNEIGWKVIDEYNVVKYEVRPGVYGEQYRIYDHQLALSSGRYTIRAIDSFGDGWGGGSWKLYESSSGDQLATGTVNGPLFPPLIPAPQRNDKRVDIVCDPAAGGSTCPVEIAMFNGASAAENGWQIKSDNGFVLKNKAPGSYADDSDTVDVVDLAPGTYSFRMTDGGSRALGTVGWQGGHVEIRNPGGYVSGYGTLEGYSAGGFSFEVDCAQADWAPLAPVPPTPVDVQCGRLHAIATTRDDGPQVGYAIFDYETSAQIMSRDAGSLFAGVVNDVVLPITKSGTYALVPKDSNGDGWAGSTVVVKDTSSNTTVASVALPDGFASAALFAVNCTDIAPPDDTADTDPPIVGLCSADAMSDCNGVCWPASFVGDGFCDDGVQYAANFNCSAHGSDGGDCRR